MSEITDAAKEGMRMLLREQPLVDVLYIVTSYCDAQTHSKELTAPERHNYRKMRAKLVRISRFADKNHL